MSDNPQPFALAPCPFCGGEACETECGAQFWIECDNCCASSARQDYPIKDAAIAAWNRRWPTQAQGEARQMIEDAKGCDNATDMERCCVLQQRILRYWNVMTPLQRECLAGISPSMPLQIFERIDDYQPPTWPKNLREYLGDDVVEVALSAFHADCDKPGNLKTSMRAALEAVTLACADGKPASAAHDALINSVAPAMADTGHSNTAALREALRDFLEANELGAHLLDTHPTVVRARTLLDGDDRG